MKSRQGYKGYVIVARSYELKDGGFSAEVSIQEHGADGVMETEVYPSDTFPTQESRNRGSNSSWASEDRRGF
jgi:hypothetical protein